MAERLVGSVRADPVSLSSTPASLADGRQDIAKKDTQRDQSLAVAGIQAGGDYDNEVVSGSI